MHVSKSCIIHHVCYDEWFFSESFHFEKSPRVNYSETPQKRTRL